ncbi:hypothetical protein MG293_000934 [Ovis ammon polii]|uniref:Uncharacterized protein n=1 Tax=Ovis ammon polii TaxID=230172 RepID=A0AAD4YHL0_OVIAM|nr:hypothetical protein MG293_000934 [Ovis ammon polii]
MSNSLVTLWTAAYQAPLSMGFLRLERESEVPQSCPTLHDPIDCSLPGFSIRGIFQFIRELMLYQRGKGSPYGNEYKEIS